MSGNHSSLKLENNFFFETLFLLWEKKFKKISDLQTLSKEHIIYNKNLSNNN